MSEQRGKISYLLLLVIALTLHTTDSVYCKNLVKKKVNIEAVKKERAILQADGEKQSDPSQKQATNDRKAKKFKGKYSDDLLVATESKTGKSDKELKVLLEGLKKLIKTEKPSIKKNELLLSKGAAYLNLAKNYRIKAKNINQFKKQEEVNLKNAVLISQMVNKSEFANNKQKARALHLQGMSYTFLHNETAAIRAFTSALEADKTSSVNPQLSIYIAEYLYDKEKYFEALPKYSEYFSKLSKEEKALAIYKSGWCFILTKQFTNAEKTFLKIAGKKWAGDFAVDSIRDLAYATVSHLGEQEIIDFGKTNFGEQDKTIIVEFYTEAYRVMIRESANIDRSLLYNEILALDSRPERKVVISLKRLNTHQREYAADIPYQDIMEIKKIIEENNFKPNSESFNYFASEFEVEIKKIVKAYADTASKKVKSFEKLSELEISRRLSNVLRLHIEWFPDSPAVPQSYALALDNCAIIKDLECTLALSREILKIDSLRNIWGRAQIQLVSALEILSKKEAKYKDEYFDELFGLVKSEENTKQWVSLAKKLSIFYVENKKFELAYPLVEKVYLKEETPENLYRKLYCSYELKKYEEVASNSKLLPPKGQPFYNELIGLFRESSIKLAQDSARGDDFNKYEEHLSEFLKLNPEEAKADLARADYFQRLLDKGENDKLLKALQELPAEKKYNDPFKKTTQTLLMDMFKNGKARDVYKFLSRDSKLGTYPEFNHYWFRALWVMQVFLNKRDHEVLFQSKSKDRASIIGMLTLSRPEAVIKYFTDFPPSEENDKRILLLSLQIIEGSPEVLIPAKYLEVIESVLPPELLNTKITSSEKLAGYIEFPNIKLSEKKLEKIMPDAVSRIRAIRAQVLRDVVGKSYLVQKRILTTAVVSETKMVDFFKAAPIPKGLTLENKKAYSEELANVATEFADQASEYQKMLVNIENIFVEMKKNDLIVPSNMKNWPKPTGEVSKLIDAELLLQNGFGALLILESQREFKNISDEDYYSLRAYSVLRMLPNSVAAKYIQDELISAKQAKLIEQWRDLIAANNKSQRDISSENDLDIKK